MAQACGEFLDGHYSVAVIDGDEQLRATTASVLKSNRMPESVFGLADWLFRKGPNMSMIHREALVLLMKNKPLAWLDKLAPAEWQSVMTNARIRGKEFNKELHHRQMALAEQPRDKLEKARAEQQQKAMRGVKIRSALVSSIYKYGFWTNAFEMESSIAKIPPSLHLDALESQLRFRQRVMRQPPPRKGIYILVQKQKMNAEFLQKKLTILFDAVDSCTVLPVDSFQMIGKRVRHRWEDEGGDYRWYEGRVINIIKGWGGKGGHMLYGIVYDFDKTLTQPLTKEDLEHDLNTGSMIIITKLFVDMRVFCASIPFMK